MAVSIEDKIELFRKMIFSDIENHSAEEKEKLLERIELEKDRLRAEAEAKGNRLLTEAEKKAEKESRQLLSKVHARQTHRLLEKKQALLEAMVALIRQEAEAFAGSGRYADYLCEKIAKACRELQHAETVRFYLTDADRSTYGDMIRSTIEGVRQAVGYELLEAPSGIIGGFYGEDGERSVQVDYTLRTLIEDSREAVGTALSSRLEEVTG